MALRCRLIPFGVVFALVGCVGDDPAFVVTAPVDAGGGGIVDDGGAPPGNADASTCASKQTRCGDACVDLTKDDRHCGSCENACETGSCGDGVCGGATIKRVATGSLLSCALRGSGSVYCWGRGDFAALGRPLEQGGVSCATSSRCQPVPSRVPDLPPVASLSVGHQGACVATRDGEVYCWGRNHAGELGTPLANSQNCDGQPCLDKPTKVAGLPPKVVEVSLGMQSACARAVSGDVYCWGDNTWGELGSGSLDASTIPVKVVLPGQAQFVVVGADHVPHACALVGARAYCWGANQAFQLGHEASRTPNPDINCQADGQSVPCNPKATQIAAMPNSDVLTSIVAGAGHTCVTTQAGTAHCWGYNGYKVGSTAAATSASQRQLTLPSPAKAIGGRFATACVLREGGRVACFGNSLDGRLGYVERNPQPCVVSVPWSCNDGSPSDVPGGEVSQFDTLEDTIVLRTDGRVFAWGPNESATLGVAPADSPDECPVIDPAGMATPCSAAPVEIVFP